VSVAARIVPGIGRVHAQSVPFAQAWEASNTDALAMQGPLWVALGDSMSQGIGARDIAGGWVGQLHTRMISAGRDFRVVNLSKTGARVHDVLDEQLPQLSDLGVEPDLITVLVGANDMLRRNRREAAVEHFRQLVAALPARSTVIATLPRRNNHALAINALVDDAAAVGQVRVADMRGRTLASLRGTRADDHFHPNELGYAGIADAFAAAIGLDQPV
jgi:lysophospholipase L1-like esterase